MKEVLDMDFVRRYVRTEEHGPATSLMHYSENLHSEDSVPYLSCSSWPPIANSWIDRKHDSYWPSKETIQTIVSKGCRIVHKPRELSEDKETEFRFSFSVAELILFRSLTCDQRKCFTAFKALIKYSIYNLENKIREEISLSTYCLKTIFLWTCETMPNEHWQTTNGWSRCLLYMIDQLYSCLVIGKIPGYFIPESNLLDSMKQSRPLLNEIRKLRSNPLTYAGAFIDATKSFRGLVYLTIISDRTNIDGHEVKGNVLTEQLTFLHRIMTNTKVTRSCLFWRREAVLRIFAKWCKQNCNDIRLALWQCMTKDMPLFDVVYLDVVHGFDIPNEVLLEYVDKKWSADFVCRLGSCYSTSLDRFNQGNHQNEVKNSVHFNSAHDAACVRPWIRLSRSHLHLCCNPDKARRIRNCQTRFRIWSG